MRGLRFLALLAWVATRAAAQDPLPSLEALEAAGAVIGEIRIRAQDVFDLDDPQEDNWLFRTANALHVQTRDSTIRRQLLFRSGERFSARVVAETERLLRGNGYLYQADIRPVAYRDGVVDLEVVTRDSWTLQPGAKVSLAGGTSSGGVSLEEENLLGTGTRLAIALRSTSEVSTAGGTRRGVDLGLSYPYAFDGHTALAYGQSTSEEGTGRRASISRPFYELDARWAAGVSSARDDRIVDRYAGGVVAARYRSRVDSARALLGVSRGLINGWVHRFSAGLRYQDEIYRREPGLAAPARLPADRTLVAPFLVYEALEDDIVEVRNLQSIARPEYLSLGWQAGLELGRAARGLGSTQAVTLYSASLGKGVRVGDEGTLLATTSVGGEYGSGEADRASLGAALRYYQRRGSHALFFLSLAADATDFSDGTQFLSLGGEIGPRGYPTNYQRGDRRVTFTAERRFYSDWFPFRLIRVGGAVFFDAGRAWGGPYQKQDEAALHWATNVGAGLRLLSARSSSGVTVHLDLAFPLKRAPGVDAFQVSVQSKTGF